MSVITVNEPRVRVTNIGQLLDPIVVRMFAQQLVAERMDFCLEMAKDDEDDVIGLRDFDTVEAFFNDCREGAGDALSDLLAEFRELMYTALKERVVEVTSVKLSKQGFEGADITIK